MSVSVHSKKTTKILSPPEAEFFDDLKPEEKRQFLIQDFFAKTWVRAVAVVTVLVVLIFFLLFPGRDAKEKTEDRVIYPSEEREAINREVLGRAIEVARRETRQPHGRSEIRSDRQKKRNYGSEIAVFVFDKEKQDKSTGRSSLRKTEQRIGLPSGAEIPALLRNRIFSFNVAAPVTAVVVKDFLWKEIVAIPKNARFLGEASVLKSIDRINVNFHRLILPDGQEFRVRAMALSEDGSSGIRGTVEKHGDVKILKAVGEALIGGAALFVGGTERDPFSLEDQMRLNLAQNLTNEATRDLRSVRVDKSVTVEAYTPMRVILLEAI